jgi:hypothetical protein
LDCSLSVCPDGTFVLTPLQKTVNRLPLSGQWKLLTNPYCITDRFYDKLVLQSYPRVEASRNNTPLQSVELDLSCRMWGKYSNGGLFRGWRPTGRMTHGTLVCKKSIPNQKAPRWRMGRPILASFSALRSSHEPTRDGWEDEKYFGY